jgi:hypothetical protein
MSALAQYANLLPVGLSTVLALQYACIELAIVWCVCMIDQGLVPIRCNPAPCSAAHLSWGVVAYCWEGVAVEKVHVAAVAVLSGACAQREHSSRPLSSAAPKRHMCGHTL